MRNLFEVTADELAAFGSADEVADRPAARGRVRDRQGARRSLRGRCAPAHLAAAGAHRLRQLQSGDAGARCRPVRPPRRLPLLRGRRHQHVPAHRARREHRRLRPRRSRSRLTQLVAVPLWLLVVLVGLALFAALEWLLLPGVRWYFRRKVRRVMSEISTRFKIELPEFKLTRRRALLDRLTTDPRVLAAVQQHARRERRAARRADAARAPLRRRDRPGLQRLRLFPGRLLARQDVREDDLPRPPRLHRRGGAGRDRSELDGGLRHEPPQQHGLRAGLVPRRRAGGAELRGRRMGAHLAAAGADPRDGRVLRAPQFRRSAVPHGAAALRADGDRGRRAAGDVSRRRPDDRRPPARAQARPARLHAEGLRPGGAARPRLHPGRHQLRPRPRRPLAAAQARPGGRRRRPRPNARRSWRASPRASRPRGARPALSPRLRLRQLRHAGVDARLRRRAGRRLPRARRRRPAPAGRRGRQDADGRIGARRAGAAGAAGRERAAARPDAAISELELKAAVQALMDGVEAAGAPRLRAAHRPRLRADGRPAHAHPARPGAGARRPVPGQSGRADDPALLRQLDRPPGRIARAAGPTTKRGPQAPF